MMKNPKKTVAKKNIKINTDIFSAPENIKYIKDLVKQSCSFSKDEFCLFKSFNNIFYLVYNSSINTTNNIIFFDLKNEQITSVIKNAHTEFIIILKHYQDKKNRRDLLLTLSMDSVKLWNINNLENLFSFEKPDRSEYQACFLNFTNDILIAMKVPQITGSYIQIYNLKKEKIKEIKDKNAKDMSLFIDSFYHNNISYIISCDMSSIKAYNYNKNKWTIYFGDKNEDIFLHFIIPNINNTLKMIGSSYESIYIWNFQTGQLLNSIKGGSDRAPYWKLCLWNNDSFFVGKGGLLELVKIKNNKLNVEKRLSGNNEFIACIKKFRHPIYGECLISKDYDGDIKLWANKPK